jgi:hypothetical protein
VAKIDDIDTRILRALVRDGRISNLNLAERCFCLFIQWVGATKVSGLFNLPECGNRPGLGQGHPMPGSHDPVGRLAALGQLLVHPPKSGPTYEFSQTRVPWLLDLFDGDLDKPILSPGK